MEVEIKKGKHYSSWKKPRLIFKGYLIGSVVFKGDFTYDLNGDTNKLIGLSDNWHHHRDSIRLGWRYYKGKKEIMVIQYKRGKRTITKLCEFEENKEYWFQIYICDGYYEIWFDKYSLELERKSKWFIHYLLKPYFGGKNKAPKDFKFEIK